MDLKNDIVDPVFLQNLLPSRHRPGNDLVLHEHFLVVGAAVDKVRAWGYSCQSRNPPMVEEN